jgi:hypothetical protein
MLETVIEGKLNWITKENRKEIVPFVEKLLNDAYRVGYCKDPLLMSDMYYFLKSSGTSFSMYIFVIKWACVLEEKNVGLENITSLLKLIGAKVSNDLSIIALK